MLYKDDWDEAASRFIAWWAGEDLGRPGLQVTAPREGAQPRHVPGPERLEDRWTDIGWLLESSEEAFKATYYGGEAFPAFVPNLGPDALAAFLGAELDFRQGTSWMKAPSADWARSTELRLEPANRWWTWMREATAAAVAAGTGKFLAGLMDLHGGGDLLGAMRGRENFCLDLIDHPEAVRDVMRQSTAIWMEVYETLSQITEKGSPGTTTWLGAWSPGRWYPVSMDELALISPSMFREFFYEDIAAQVDWLDHSLFHLDGPDCIRHLGILLELENLDGVQWVAGARSTTTLEWVPLLKRIQAAGKLLHISVRADEVEPLLRELSPRGLMLATWCSSEGEARDLLEASEKWGAAA